MTESQCIEKRGTVINVIDKIAYVQLSRIEACDACRMKGMCHTDTAEDPHFHELPAQDLCIGDQVNLVIAPNTGLKAILLAYIMPFVLMIVIMILALALSVHEGIAGLIALLSLIPYFLILRQGKLSGHSFLQIDVQKL